MIIRGTPDDISQFYIADADIAFKLQQAGLRASYIDNEAVYFRKNNKLIKLLEKFGVKET